MIFKYYGVDCVAFGFVIAHLWMLGHHNRKAWIFGILACLCFVFFGFLCESMATIIMNFVFMGLHVRNYILWGKYEKISRL